MSDNSPGDRISFKLEKWVAVIAPCVTYFLVYTFEVSYCGVFDIPKEFIRPDVVTILGFTSILMPSLLVINMLLDGWLSIPKVRDVSPIKYAVDIYFPILVTTVILIVLIGFDRTSGKILLGFYIVVFLLDFLRAYTIRNKSEPKVNFLFHLKGPWIFTEPGQPLYAPFKYLNREVFFWVAALYVSYVLCDAWGSHAARSTEKFLVPSTDLSSVVVRCYGDKIILVGIDRDSLSLKGGISLIQQGSNPNLKLISEKIGKLKLK